LLLYSTSFGSSSINRSALILEQSFETEISVESEFSSTNSSKAGGFVKLINKNNKDQTLIATTRLLSSDNKLYRLKEKVVIPQNSEIRAWVEADQEGEDFVGPAGKMIIPGLLQKSKKEDGLEKK